MRALLDTSVLLGGPVDGLPDDLAISSATLAELHFGVHRAVDERARRRRVRRLGEIEATFDPLPIDGRVARAYGELAVEVTLAGRQPRTRVMDTLIAATAFAHGLLLFTHDRRDFAPFAELIDVRVV